MIKLINILKTIILQEHYAGLEYPKGEDWDKTVAIANEIGRAHV